MSLKIAMVGTRGVPASYGGVERAVEELSAELVHRGHDVTVYAREAYSDADVTEHRGIEVVRHRQVNSKHLEAISHTALAVISVVRRRHFDIVHFHATGPSLLSFIPRLFGVPTVVTVQGLDYRREKWGRLARTVLGVASWTAHKFPTRTIVVSRELQRHYRETFRAHTAYIPNGVIPFPPSGDAFEDLAPQGYVLFLGRLVPEKHVHTLIAAYAQVDTDLPLVIAGPSSHSPDYVAQLEQLARADARLRLVGPRYGGEKDWLVGNALAFVQPSSVEGLPIALLEALSCARYPIVSNIPENLEPVTVDGRILGRSVPPGDPEALAAAIRGAIDMSPDERANVGRRLASHVAKTYNWTHIAAETERVYQDALGVDDGRDARPSR